MITYFISVRNKPQTQDWTMTEAPEDLGDVYRCPYTGDTSMVVLLFKAPGWEDARRVYDWRVQFERRPRLEKKLYEWDEIRMLVDKESQHVAIQEERPQPRGV